MDCGTIRNGIKNVQRPKIYTWTADASCVNLRGLESYVEYEKLTISEIASESKNGSVDIPDAAAK